MKKIESMGNRVQLTINWIYDTRLIVQSLHCKQFHLILDNQAGDKHHLKINREILEQIKYIHIPVFRQSYWQIRTKFRYSKRNIDRRHQYPSSRIKK